jgi:drug/metabolite transporter (DMT)-like permease
LIYLLIVSLIWAFSFGIIKGQLTSIDPNFVAFARLLLSFLVFIPFIKIQNLKRKFIFQFILLGMIQYGVMYVTYILSYQYLKAYQVALFTIFTPLYVTLINDILHKKFHFRFLFSAVISVLGTAVIVFDQFSDWNLRMGFVLVQVSNIAFAFGQIYYRKLMRRVSNITDLSVFGLLYMGAVIFTGIFSMVTTDYSSIVLETNQIWALIYLGVIASGICFFLWNFGARKTNPGILAVFNNIKIPAAIVVSLLFFGESADIIKLTAGLIIIAFAFLINESSFFNRILNKKGLQN